MAISIIEAAEIAKARTNDLRPCPGGIELQTTPTLYAGIRDALCPTRAVHREGAWCSWALHTGVVSGGRLSNFCPVARVSAQFDYQIDNQG
jgi:hypothetical protein